MKSVSILIFAALVTLTGCKPKQTTLSGQIFIVTQGAENIRLGDVKVLLLQKSHAAVFLQKKQAGIESEKISRQNEIVTAKEAAESAHADFMAFLSQKPSWMDADNPNQNKKAELMKTTQNRLLAARSKLENFPTSEYYFLDFPMTAVQETRTDADGKFSFTYPCNQSLAIFASAQRIFLNRIERYYWLIDAPANIESTQIFLSNNNLVEVDPDNYFTLKPKQIVQESPAQ